MLDYPYLLLLEFCESKGRIMYEKRQKINRVGIVKAKMKLFKYGAFI